MVKTRWIAQIAFSTFAEELLQQREGKNQKLFPKASMQNEGRRYAKIVPATTECGG
jgi:hypothetical protein